VCESLRVEEVLGHWSMGLQLSNLNEGFSMKKLIGEFFLLPLVFFMNFGLGVLFFDKNLSFCRGIGIFEEH
jgi:hypothetical protein